METEMGNDQRELDPGTDIGGCYRIESRIGAGGMGTVYKAHDLRDGRAVAIKVLNDRFLGKQKSVARFMNEAERVREIRHENVCEVLDIGLIEEKQPYFVMPLLDGEPLSQLLKREKLDLGRCVRIVAQTLSALAAAHAARIVHRDLKPDNIFVVRGRDQEEERVVLLDFGICKSMDDRLTELTETGTVLGTPFYMAPEQARGFRDFDHRVDLYAVGVILYQAATLRRPFEGESYNEVMYRIINEPFVPPRTFAPGLPRRLEALIIKALQKDPAVRYADANEMRSALLDALLPTQDSDAESELPATTATVELKASQAFTPTPSRGIVKHEQRRLRLLVPLALIAATAAVTSLLLLRPGASVLSPGRTSPSAASEKAAAHPETRPAIPKAPAEEPPSSPPAPQAAAPETLAPPAIAPSRGQTVKKRPGKGKKTATLKPAPADRDIMTDYE